MKIGSLCTGYGGLDLAVETFFSAETIWCAEFDKYASQVIEQRFAIPNYGDIKLIDWAILPQIDILTAGYPCQPFSNAGQRKGTDDSRHIWPHIQKAIGILRPQIVVMENVRGHITLGFKEVLQGLTEIGYDAKWRIVRASDAGAPHRRERLFIIAEPTDTNRERSNLGKQVQEWNQGQSQLEFGSLGESITTDTNRTGLQGTWNASRNVTNVCIGDTNDEYKSYNRQMSGIRRRFTSRREMHLQTPPNPLDNNKLNPKFVEYMMGLPAGWVTDLPLSRSQQLKMLGNGVVPQQAELALELLTGLSTGGDNEL